MNLSKLISSYPSWNVCLTISGGIEVTCDVFRDLVSFVQFKKVWKHPWRRVTFSKSTTPPWVFFPFFKLCKVYQIVQSIKINSLKFACLIIFMDNEKTKIIEIQCTFLKFWKKKIIRPAGNYMYKVNNRNTRTRAIGFALISLLLT